MDVGFRIGDGRKPVLQFGVEAVLGAAGLEVEEAQHQRAGEAEQRGREGRAHAGQRRGEAELERVEAPRRVAPPTSSDWMVSPIEPIVCSRPQKVPSRPRKTSKPDQIARDVAALVEARGDGIEDRAHRGGRQRHRGRAAEQRLHRRQQHRIARVGSRPGRN
jgi:hypothetical protein